MEGGGVVIVNAEEELMMLPPGFRFHPTDEEIITHYLKEKVTDNKFSAKAIGEVDLNRCEPWDLPKKAKMGEKEWFFFCQRDRKYPTGMRTNRATESGYWKATGKDKEIFMKGKNQLVGMKKTLVFYKGRAPKGEKTNWVMHEYRLEGKFSYYNFPKPTKDEWVVCKVFHKNTGIRRSPIQEFTRMDSFVEHLLDSPHSLPPLMDLPNNNSNNIIIPNQFPRFKNGDYEDDHDHQEKPFSFNTQYSSWPQISPPQQNYDYNKYFINTNQASTSSNNSFPNPNQNLPHQTSSERIMSSRVWAGTGICKAEQFSCNDSMVSISQDTGLSTDVGPEISSVISKPNNVVNNNNNAGGNNAFEDLYSFWDY